MGKCFTKELECDKQQGTCAQKSAQITENSPLSPHTPYAVSKTAIDWISGQCYSKFGLNVIRARAFNHSGPGQSSIYVISDFARQIAAIEKGLKAPVIDVGNLETYKDFTDVRDIAHAYHLLLEKGKPGEAYNIASGKLYKIADILEKLISLSKIKIKVNIDQQKFRPVTHKTIPISMAKLKKDVGWSPTIPLKKTLEDTLQWWRDAEETTNE